MNQSIRYFVNRTELGKNLPVYQNYFYQGKKIVTMIRKIDGDLKVK